MVDLAIYKKNHLRDVFQINDYYKSDYIFWNTLRSCIAYTIIFFICLIFYVLCNTDMFFYNINTSGIYDIINTVGVIFFVGFFIYAIISVAVYSSRYKKAKKGMYFYASKLKRFAKKYHYVDRT